MNVADNQEATQVLGETPPSPDPGPSPVSSQSSGCMNMFAWLPNACCFQGASQSRPARKVGVQDTREREKL